MVLAGGFMVSAIIPILIGVCYDLTGNHTWTYLDLSLINAWHFGNDWTAKKKTS